MLLNADRRAAQERYDDAVGRLYRALELLSQIRLSTYNLKTGDIDIQQLPKSLQAKYAAPVLRSKDGKIQLALNKSYGLLSELPNEPLSPIYQQQANQIQNALQIRNYSLFAHRFKPIMKADYQACSTVVVDFIKSSIAALISPKSKFRSTQFPQDLHHI